MTVNFFIENYLRKQDSSIPYLPVLLVKIYKNRPFFVLFLDSGHFFINMILL
jgi:hypothetical protein